MNNIRDTKDVFYTECKISVKDLTKKIETLNARESKISQGDKSINSETKKPNPLFKILPLSERVMLAVESNYIRSSSLQEKNNISDINSLFRNDRSIKNIILSFKRSEYTKSYKRCILVDDVEINISSLLDISKATYFILNYIPNSNIIIEYRSGYEERIIALATCILSYNDCFSSIESARIHINMVLKHTLIDIRFSQNSLRCINNFDRLRSIGKEIVVFMFKLNHLILVGIPKLANLQSKDILIQIATMNSTYTLDVSKYFVDENFLIVSNINLLLYGDVEVLIVFKAPKIMNLMFRLTLNTIFYKHGILRFSRHDIETLNNTKDMESLLSNNFSVDLIVSEEYESNIINPYAANNDYKPTIRYIIERVFNDYSEEIMAPLKDLGFDRDLAILCAQMCLDLIEAKLVKKRLNESREVSRSKSSAIPVVENVITNPSEKVVNNIFIDKNKEIIDYSQLYIKEDNINFIDLIHIEDPKPDIKKLTKIKSGIFSRRKKQKDQHIDLHKRAIKNIHISSLSNIDGTIFEGLSSNDEFFDYEIFENHFCTDSAVFELKAERRRENYKIEHQRLFLISLAIKSLELNNITADTLPTILKSNNRILSSEDLTNILKIIPEDEKEEEDLLLLEDNDRNIVPRIMLQFAKIPELRRTTLILKYERTFFEEIEVLTKTINNMNICINKIMCSVALDEVFGVVLQIINALNYKYSKNNSKIDGFKIDSLTSFSGFNVREHSLIIFLVDILRRKDFNFSEIDEIRKMLIINKNTDMMNVKIKINYLIDEYKKAFALYEELSLIDNTTLAKFLAFASKRLYDISFEYKYCMEKAYKLNTRFGENEQVPISYCFNIIMNFLDKLIVCNS